MPWPSPSRPASKLDEPGQRLSESVAAAAKLWGADLIVTGSHGWRGIGRVLLGAVRSRS